MKLTLSTIVLLTCLLLDSINLSAMQRGVTSDSLRVLIELENDSDEKIALHLDRAGRLHVRYNADSTLYHNQEARKLFSHVEDSTQYLMKLHANYVLAYGFRGEYKKALNSIKDVELVLDVEFSKLHKSEAEREEHSKLLFRTMNAVGDIYRKIEDYEKSYTYFIKASEIAETMKEKKYRADGFNNLGMLYNEQGDDVKAKAFYLRAIDLNKKAVESDGTENDLYKLGTNYNNIGNSYKNLEKYDSAEMAYKASMDIMIDMKIKYAEAVILDNLGNLFLKKGDHQQALAHRRKALEIQRGIGSIDQQSILLAGISEILIELKNWREAETNALEAFALAQANDQPGNVRTSSELLVQINDSLGNMANAYKYLLIFKEKDDLLSGKVKERAIENLRIGYETEQSEAENLLLKQKGISDQSLIEKQRLYMYAFILTIVFVSSFSILLYRVYRSTSRQKKLIQNQASKLQALDAFKSRFFANVSHDLRTPLTLIQGHIHQIKEEENYLNSKSEESLRKLEGNAGRLIQLTDEIRDLILLEDDRLHLEYREVEIGDYLKRLVNLFSSAAEMKMITLSFESAIQSPRKVHLDSTQFEKIIYNLIANALKFTAVGGNITVRLKEQDNSIVIEVEDDGAGISEEKVSHIFNRYYQASEETNYNKEGLGIGLALVLELIMLHGGDVNVKSEIGKGTLFSVSLPFNLDKKTTSQTIDNQYILNNKDFLVEEEENTEGFVDTLENIKRAENAAVVLIVDDHPDIRSYIKELMDEKYIIRQAGNGKEALEILGREKIDIVITDLMMPWMDGHDLIAKMKDDEVLTRIPVLVVSARTTEEDKIKVLEKGINNFLAKPFQPDQLKLRIANMLSKAQQGSDIWENLALDKKKLSTVEQNLLSKVNTLILSRIDDPGLTVNHIAEALITSSRNAFRMINELAGMSPKDYINHIKFQYAGDLMKKKKVKSVSEAARAVGMSNPTHFSTQFQKRTGKRPVDLIT